MPLSDNLARFADIAEDTEAFQDVQDPANRRVIKYPVARHSAYSPIRNREDLTVAILESMPGKGPKLHAHDYPEIFFCQEGRYGIVWGDHGEHCVTLNPLDTFAVPPGINRLVMNTGDSPGTMMVLFDTTRRDPNEGITMPEHVIAEERASGKDYTRRAAAGVPMTEDEVAEYVGLFADLPVAGTDGDMRVKRVIRTGDGDAAIAHPHNLTMTLLESDPGEASDESAPAADELLICLNGAVTVESHGEAVSMARFDTLPVPAGTPRRLVNGSGEPATVLVVGKP
ncbi:MAG: cupin domain-containing protein [Alphaproteobacteria bacterium]|nr:cupin domain-containing protein [Alphaproteobacteria bacterium]